MTARRYSYGIRIEGIGSDTTKSAGQCWYWGNRLSPAQKSASDFEWIGGPGSRQGLVALPEGAADSSVSLWTADLSNGTIAPSLHLDDVAGAALMRRDLEPAGVLDEDLTAAETDVSLSTEFDDDAFEGTVVYIGDEAILLVTHTGAGTFTCTRGYWGTHAQVLPRYTRVYLGLPYRKSREITLVRYNHADDSEETRWFGTLDDAPPTDSEHARLEVGATEILATIARGTVNRGAPDLTVEGGIRGEPASSLDVFNGALTGNYGMAQGEVLPRPARVRFYDVKANTAHIGAFQLDTTLIFGTWTIPYYSVGFDGVTQYALGSPEPESAAPLYEVLVVARELDVVDGIQVDDAGMRSSTAALEYPFHPAAVWLAMTVDHPDYNVLGPDWNLGCPTAWFDIDDIEATIARTRHIKIDRLVLGWDGEEVNPWEEFKKWCRTYGLFPCIRADGRVSVREAREAGPAEVFGAPTVTALPYRLHWRPSEGDGIDIISGRYGELPWSKGAPFEVQILDFTDPSNPVPQHSRRNGILAERSKGVIDMPTRSDVGSTAEGLNGLAAARHIGAPKLGLRVDDQGFGHGDFVRLAPLDTRDDVLRDSTGQRIAVDDSAKWVGIAVSKRSSYEEDIAEIELHLANYNSGRFPRFRSATAVIASAAGDTMTLESGVYVVGGDDGAAFTEGDPVQIWTENYARRSSEVLVIDTINSDEIVFTTVPSTTPQAGDKIEIAFLSTASGYPETGNPALYDGLAYAFMCDDANTIGPNDLEGHIYGTGAA